MDLADVLLGNPDDGARVPTLRAGVVVSTSPFAVRVGSAATAQPCTPLLPAAVGALVMVLVVNGDRFALGPAATPWYDVTFNTGWSNYDGAGSAPNRSVQYRRVGDVVELRGVAKPAAASPSSTSATIFTLPAGFRHPYTDRAFAVCIDGSAKTVNVFGTGAVAVYGASTVTAGGYVFLDGIRFAIA